MNYPYLGPKEAPENCLFFLLPPAAVQNARLWEEKTSAQGIAAMVTPGGILATAAHVLWMHNLGPGNTVTVFGASATLPLRATALVLERGWRGPIPGEPGSMAHPAYEGKFDERRDVILEDMALLQLDHDSIEFDPERGGEAPAWIDLAGRLRVMPVGVPGYPINSRTSLQAWCVFKDDSVPVLAKGSGQYYAPAPSLYHAFQFTSEDITYGFSGGPLWDDERHLCVGYVRSYLGPKENAMLVATDARALQRFGGIAMMPDASLELTIQTTKAAIDTMPGAFYLAEQEERSIVMPWARPLRQRAALDDGADDPPTLALDLLHDLIARGCPVCLACGAGTGKSTMLATLARDLLERPDVVGRGQRLLPVLLVASELPAQGLDLPAMLGALLSRSMHRFGSVASFAEALALNDVAIVLLVDALDEVDKAHARRIINQCMALVRNTGPVQSVVLATRPDPTLLPMLTQRNRWDMQFLELLPFDEAQVDAFALQHFPDPQARLAYTNALRGVDWVREATPWQLEMAASVHQYATLGRSEASLIFDFIAIRLGEVERGDGDLHVMLGMLAQSSLNESDYTIDQAKALLDAHFGPAKSRTLLLYLERSAASRMSLVRSIESEKGMVLQWVHRSVQEGLAAQAIVHALADQPAQLRAALKESNIHDQRFILILLSAMQDSKLTALVNERIEMAIGAPFTDFKEALLALRALAAGIEFEAGLRDRLVRLLIRVVLAPSADRTLCAEFFATSTSLPSARSIVQRPELRGHIRRALWDHFRLRARATGRVVQVSAQEAALLDLLQMWNEWVGDGLVLVPRERTPASAATPATSPRRQNAAHATVQVLDRGGFTMVDSEGMMRNFEMPAQLFLQGVAAFAQKLPRNLAPAQIVHLYLRGMSSGSAPLASPDAPDDLPFT